MGKRGPKKIPGKREPNGQITRRQEAAAARSIDRDDKAERDVLAVGVAARKRVLGVSLDVAQDQRAGTVVGRWCMAGIISPAEYQAALRWQEDADRYGIAMCSPRQPGAIDLNATKGDSTAPERVHTSQRAYDIHERAILAIQEHQNRLRGNGALFAALYHVVQRDMDLEHMRGDVALALHTLVQHYGIREDAKAA